MNIYLRSGIPVVLGVDIEGEIQHAVVALGYESKRTSKAAFPFRRADGGRGSVRLRNLDAGSLFIHDDRIGPYLNARLLHRKSGIQLRLQNLRAKPMTMLMAFAPMYPKLRTSAEQLVRRAFDILPLVDRVLPSLPGDLEIEMFFERSGSYQESLFGMGLSTSRLSHFQQRVALSRYVERFRPEPAFIEVSETVVRHHVRT
jgi:hypothetical protein